MQSYAEMLELETVSDKRFAPDVEQGLKQVLEQDPERRLQPELQRGLAHQAAGRILDAAQCYQRAHHQDPEDTDALLLLGILARQAKQHEAAIRLTALAVTRRPGDAVFHLNLALAYFSAGDLNAAEQCCRRALDLHPSNSASWCCLGDVEAARGHEHEARIAWERAIACGSRSAHPEVALGNLLYRRQEYEQALAVYRAGICRVPGDNAVRFCLAAALAAMERRQEAIATYHEVLRLRPAFPEALLNLGSLRHDEGSHLAAVNCYRKALALRPDYLKAWCNMGNALQALKRFQDAATCYRQALQLNPDISSAQHSLGKVLMELREIQTAEAYFRRAVELEPRCPEYHNSLGNALLRLDRNEESAACYRKALAIRPDYSIAHTNLANALLQLGRKGEMVRHYEYALQLNPNNAGGHYNLALAYLREGKYREGWREHEWRWEFRELKLKRRSFNQPQWTGEPLQGKTILLHAEQGLGDTLQFVRYAPLVAERGGVVVLEVQPRLARLLKNLHGPNPLTGRNAVRVIARGEPLPELACHCPLMSLPYVFATTVETIPANTPYLRTDDDETDGARTQWPGDGLRIGIAWAGNPKYKSDRQRSLPLEKLLPLTGVAGISWFSLQMGPATAQMRALTSHFPLADASSASRDLAETAALVSTLDLVISVDTSIAHLAGAMGVPVWVVLSHLADWRWLEDRADSPWYPTARLFRQKIPGDWSLPVTRMRDELQALALRGASLADRSG